MTSTCATSGPGSKTEWAEAEIFIWAFRGIAIVIILFWVRALVHARDKPADWIAPTSRQVPIKLTRDRYRMAAILGIAAGVGILLFSLILPAIA